MSIQFKSYRFHQNHSDSIQKIIRFYWKLFRFHKNRTDAMKIMWIQRKSLWFHKQSCWFTKNLMNLITNLRIPWKSYGYPLHPCDSIKNYTDAIPNPCDSIQINMIQLKFNGFHNKLLRFHINIMNYLNIQLILYKSKWFHNANYKDSNKIMKVL